MAEKVLAAVKIGAKQTEPREFSLPDVPVDAGLLKVEAAGICGSDVNSYPRPIRRGPHIMGHENIGIVVYPVEAAWNVHSKSAVSNPACFKRASTFNLIK